MHLSFPWWILKSSPRSWYFWVADSYIEARKQSKLHQKVLCFNWSGHYWLFSQKWLPVGNYSISVKKSYFFLLKFVHKLINTHMNWNQKEWEPSDMWLRNEGPPSKLPHDHQKTKKTGSPISRSMGLVGRTVSACQPATTHARKKAATTQPR